MKEFSLVIPAKNEAEGLSAFLPELKSAYPNAEVIVVDDGSTDETLSVCQAHGISIVSHTYSKGNGSAIKTGARAATHDTIVFMDGDGQHNVSDIEALLEGIESGYDMVVGARVGMQSQANFYRGGANRIYNKLASWMVGHRIEDLTSGFRAVKAKKFKEFLYLLPNGFSYPTTSTMAFFRAGYSVAYTPIKTNPRIGKSHLHIFKDGIRFLLIIFKVGTLYSPLKMFFPISLGVTLIGLLYYLYTYISFGRFTNMSALLFTTGLTVFMMGLISEQITMLIYKRDHEE